MAKVDELVSLPLPLYIPLPLCPVLFFHRTNIPYQVATTSTVSEVHRVLPMPKMEETGKIHGKKQKKNENASILQLISFQRKTGQKMDYIII